jgi:hypothetical protein
MEEEKKRREELLIDMMRMDQEMGLYDIPPLKKVIFLDNDGVICLSDNWGSRFKKARQWMIDEGLPEHAPNVINEKTRPVKVRLDNFDKKAVNVLNEILEKTGAEIVVSSDWRYHATLEELGEYYESQGIIKRPIAVTGMFKDLFPKEWSAFRFRAELELERSMEIGHWLEQHPEVTHWVAVDDLNMSIEFLSKYFSHSEEDSKNPGLKNFVLTPKSSEGIKQSGIKEKILAFLTN